MAPEKPVATSEVLEAADLAKALQEMAKAERTAAAMEDKLDRMEAKIDALLAKAEQEQEEVQRSKGGSAGAASEGNTSSS